MAHESTHEPAESLSPATLDMHRALVSLMEELEAVDWYAQRAAVCADPELRAVLKHNMGEEVEHAMMMLEWIRRRDPVFDVQAHRYLFSAEPLAAAEAAAKRADPSAAPAPPGAAGSLGIGSLKG